MQTSVFIARLIEREGRVRSLRNVPAVIARSASDEAIHFSSGLLPNGLLRCARNDELTN